MKKEIYTIPIYYVDLHIVCVESLEETNKVLAEQHNDPELLNNVKHIAGITSYDNEGNFQILFNKELLSHGIIAHEVFHFSEKLHDYLGAKEEFTGEHAANLCEYVTNLVYLFFSKNKVKVPFAPKN